MNHFKVCCNLILVTNAKQKVVESAIALIKSTETPVDIDEVTELLNHLGYIASWDNYQDLVSIDL